MREKNISQEITAQFILPGFVVQKLWMNLICMPQIFICTHFNDHVRFQSIREQKTFFSNQNTHTEIPHSFVGFWERNLNFLLISSNWCESTSIAMLLWLFCSYTVSNSPTYKSVHTLVIPKKTSPFGMQTHKSIRQMVIETGSETTAAV